jgi:hypothetical protein
MSTVQILTGSMIILFGLNMYTINECYKFQRKYNDAFFMYKAYKYAYQSDHRDIFPNPMSVYDEKEIKPIFP